jgi:esterase
MNLNVFADGVQALDMLATEEFASLTSSATDLSIPHGQVSRYVSRNLVVRQHRFHLLEWGAEDAPELVMLHGGHQSCHSWDLVSLHFSDRFRVITPDQRGHGDSEWARNSEYTTLEMATDAAAMIRGLELKRPVVMGHSMGGRNTLTMALNNPGLARALVIVDVGPEISDEGRKTIGSFIRDNAEFDDLDHFVENVRRYDPYRSREHIERTVRYNLFKRADGKFVSKCDRAPRRLGLHERAPVEPDALTLDAVRSLDLPVLVVRGASSNILAPDAAERFVDALPQGQLVTVPECGHNVHSQNTVGFIDAVGEFLSGLDD